MRNLITIRVGSVCDTTVRRIGELLKAEIRVSEVCKRLSLISSKVFETTDDHDGLGWFILDWNWIRQDSIDEEKMEEFKALCDLIGLSTEEATTASFVWINPIT